MLSATTQAIKLMRIPCAYMICDVSDREQVYRKVRCTFKLFLLFVQYIDVISGMAISGPAGKREVWKCGDPSEQCWGCVWNECYWQHYRANGADCAYQSFRADLGKLSWLHLIVSHPEFTIIPCLQTTKAFLPAMMQANHGHIVSISSMLGLMGLPGAADYSASKHGTTAFMRCLALELAADGYSNVHTTCVHPYLINNEMFAGVTTRSSRTVWPINLMPCFIPSAMLFTVLNIGLILTGFHSCSLH